MRAPMLFLVLLVIGCGSGPEFEVPSPSTTRLPTSADTPYYDRLNDFGFQLLSEMDLSENVAFSPVAVGHNMAVLMNGASGPTRDELLALFRLDETNKDAFNEAQRALLNRFHDIEGEPLKAACAVFPIWPVVIDKAFASRMGENYEAVVKKLGGATLEAKRLINVWVRERTGGRIPELETDLRPEDALFVVSVAHFADAWNEPFDASKTRRSSFVAPGGPVSVPMMSRTGEYGYYEDETMQAVVLAYIESQQLMALMLPKEGDVAALVGSLDSDLWRKILKWPQGGRGTVSFPRFAFQAEYELIPNLEGLGVQTLFQPSCNLRHIAIDMERGYAVRSVKHKAVIEVDEEGTKASTATSSASGAGMALPKTPFSFVANRPFVFAIVDNKTGVVAFLGVVNDPTKG